MAYDYLLGLNSHDTLGQASPRPRPQLLLELRAPLKRFLLWLCNQTCLLLYPKVAPSSGSKLKRPTFHSSRTSLTGDTSNSSSPASSGAKTSRAGSHAGSRTSSRRGSDASDFDLLETQSACSDTSESSATGGGGGQGGSRRGLAKPSKIPTMSKKTSTAKSPGPKR
ncbi:Microtubule-actin cross-linking factor 1, isoform 4, partial [Ophiophagus hannah]